MPGGENTVTDTLRGIIERITYHSEETGYTVAQLTPDGAGYTVPVIGPMLGINVGESVGALGVKVQAQLAVDFLEADVRVHQPAMWTRLLEEGARLA